MSNVSIKVKTALYEGKCMCCTCTRHYCTIHQCIARGNDTHVAFSVPWILIHLYPYPVSLIQWLSASTHCLSYPWTCPQTHSCFYCLLIWKAPLNSAILQLLLNAPMNSVFTFSNETEHTLPLVLVVPTAIVVHTPSHRFQESKGT